MTKHYEKADGLFEDENIDTQNFVFNQPMLRIKDPNFSFIYIIRMCLGYIYFI